MFLSNKASNKAKMTERLRLLFVVRGFVCGRVLAGRWHMVDGTDSIFERPTTSGLWQSL